MCSFLSVSSSFFMTIGALSPNQAIAQIVAPISVVLFLLYGGFYVNTASVPVYYIWIQYISFFRYGYQVFVITGSAEGRPYICLCFARVLSVFCVRFWLLTNSKIWISAAMPPPPAPLSMRTQWYHYVFSLAILVHHCECAPLNEVYLFRLIPRQRERVFRRYTLLHTMNFLLFLLDRNDLADTPAYA